LKILKKYSSDNLEDDEEGDENTVLIPCKHCKRKFREENIEKHESVCKQIFCQTRRKFDTKKKRTLDSEHAMLLKKKELEEKQNNNLQEKNKKKDKWKKSSEEFRAIIKMGTTGEGFGGRIIFYTK
jgi:acetyl-CoA carboxylase beta subunit